MKARLEGDNSDDGVDKDVDRDDNPNDNWRDDDVGGYDFPLPEVMDSIETSLKRSKSASALFCLSVAIKNPLNFRGEYEVRRKI